MSVPDRPDRGAGKADLEAVLARSRDLGLLGPGAVGNHVEHAGGFGEVVEAVLGAPPARFADLGTGGGVPGLVLAGRWSGAFAVLVDSNVRRAGFLRDAVERLGLGGRVEVRQERGEAVAHAPGLREAFAAVTARAFAEPAATAEIAAGLVAPGGVLVVSEPPEVDPSRWPARELAGLGFGAAVPYLRRGAHYVAVLKIAPAPTTVPRAVGRPAKRPRW